MNLILNKQTNKQKDLYIQKKGFFSFFKLKAINKIEYLQN